MGNQEVVQYARGVGRPRVARRYRERLSLLRDLLARFDDACAYCMRRGTAMQDPDGGSWVLEHMVPLCRGGADEPANITLACTRCNRSRGASTPEEFLPRIVTQRGHPPRACTARPVPSGGVRDWDGEPLIGSWDVARLLGVSPSTVAVWLQNGLLTAYRTEGLRPRWRVRARDLLAFVRANNPHEHVLAAVQAGIDAPLHRVGVVLSATTEPPSQAP